MCAVCVQEADQAQSVEKGAEEQIVSVGEQAQNGSVEEEGVKDGTAVEEEGVKDGTEVCTGCILLVYRVYTALVDV